MKENIQSIKYVLSVLMGAAVSAMGGCDDLFLLFVTLVAADFLFGLIKSIKAREFSSSVARWGFVNKLIEFAIIAICFRIDIALNDGALLRNMALVWFCICEGASILENCAYMGLPIPEGIVGVLVQAKKGFSVNFADIAKHLLKNFIKASEESDDNGDHQQSD